MNNEKEKQVEIPEIPFSEGFTPINEHEEKKEESSDSILHS